jgi:hypothetical protein
MKKILCLILFLTSTLHAGIVEWNGQQVHYDDKWSQNDFSNSKAYTILNVNLPDGSTIYRSSFYREDPYYILFQTTAANITLLECNVDNIVIPDGWLVNNLYRPAPIQFTEQNDRRDWILDIQGKPVKVENEDFWKMQGKDVDPKDIPLTKIGSVEQIPNAVISVDPVIDAPAEEIKP